MDWLARQGSLFLWLFLVVSRNKIARNLLIVTTVILIAAGYFVGLMAVLQIIFMIGRLLFMFMFIALQFIGMFWILSRSKAVESRPGDPKTITFDDYWGNDYIVREVRQWTTLLTGHDTFEKMGGQTISGILLSGPPGTGKSYLAKALAGDSGVAFYGLDGSSFRAMFMGIDILKVRSFFRKGRSLAREYGGCILYLDEIDAIGASRGAVEHFEPVLKQMMGGMMGGGSGALTRMLYELDGLDETPLRDQCEDRIRKWLELPPVDRGRIIVMGATNRPDVLDPALVRAGRLDKRIHVGYPDKKSRREIITGYLGRVRHDDDIDIESLVSDTPHITPAQLMSAITRDGPRRALFDGREQITQADIERALQEQLLGLENPISDLEPDQKWQIAVHEAGHAVATHVLRPDKRIVRVSIIRRSDALGYVLPVEKTDIYTTPFWKITADICVSLAGDAATEVLLGERWTGAAGDYKSVLARTEHLGANGFFGFKAEPDFEVVDEYISECREAVVRVLREHVETLEKLAKVLVEEEDLPGARVLEVIGG